MTTRGDLRDFAQELWGQVIDAGSYGVSLPGSQISVFMDVRNARSSIRDRACAMHKSRVARESRT